ncbi:Thiamin pyrophosphokinase [Neurospora crassa]|uniref:Thiamine pyrophosphokinase Thi80 n=1 Tax=Neurospora crassa (strain ATCC 24698 / 74-OR23-1A / CBS 708.71 / DSM 1257 / FGSC 987) TaxID=367110 RepID=Q7S3S3_NEUCR|nr:thiamine pyrophosphokinase Thi80 [Neurospora crassa OR74A]EAA30156.2 thiamine pyrophosphokinase Thi80 [Neurospora crassa OR74A]KHE81596.1 Thiamin pyrophosphokinase [Neurospora crassa]|eukprot:XP_959392.2 thiamine pyrophosphokinase Thi80 [Neurospora crassa OR74A]
MLGFGSKFIPTKLPSISRIFISFHVSPCRTVTALPDLTFTTRGTQLFQLNNYKGRAIHSNETMGTTNGTTQSTGALDEGQIFEWYPLDLVRDYEQQKQHDHNDQLQNGSNGTTHKPEPFALVVLNQPLTHLGLVKRLWKNASIRVAADGGANCLYDVAGKNGDHDFDDLTAIIGDLDSLTTETRTYFTTHSSSPTASQTAIIHEPSQYSTDFAKSVDYLRGPSCSKPDAPPPDIVAIGGLGGRVDQGLSQLHHLYLFQSSPTYADGRMYLFSGESLTFLLKSGTHRIRVREPGQANQPEKDVFAKWVGILPVKEPSRIWTKGLEWDVEDWPTEFGGQVSTSNHVLPETEVVEVRATKDVLFTIALRDL